MFVTWSIAWCRIAANTYITVNLPGRQMKSSGVSFEGHEGLAGDVAADARPSFSTV